MSDNLTNEIKTSLFANGSVVVATAGGDVTPSLIQPKQYDDMEKYNLDQRDDITVVLHAVSGTIAAGAVFTVKYYNRVPNQIEDSVLLATETKTLAAVSAGSYLAIDFLDAAIEYADYFTIECTLKQASGTDYTVTGNVIVKKKISSGTSTTASFTSTDIVGGLFTLSHGSGTTNIAVTVYDNDGKQVIPDDVTIIDGNTVSVDLTSFGIITGNWSIVVLSAGGIATPVGEVWGNITGNIGNQTDLATALTNYRPRILQSAPDTSTTGFLGEVVYDVSSNKWTCIKIDGSTYYWAPEGFPDVNTEYASHVEAGTIVWKYRWTLLVPGYNSLRINATSIPSSYNIVDYVARVNYINAGNKAIMSSSGAGSRHFANGMNATIEQTGEVYSVLTGVSNYTGFTQNNFKVDIFYTK